MYSSKSKSDLEKSQVKTSGRGGEDPISFPSKVVNTSIDTLYLSYKIDYYSGGLFDKLQIMKESLQAGMDQDKVFNIGEKDEFNFTLQRSGRKFFRYVLRSGDCFFCLTPRESSSNIPNMQLQIGSITCQVGVKSYMNGFYQFIEKYVGKIKQEIVSRIDICADINYKFSMSGVTYLSHQISQTNNCQVFYSYKKANAIMIGKGDLTCRIYDKILEMEKSQDAIKMAFFMQKWAAANNGKRPEHITRCEFQIRREKLKELKIADLGSWFENEKPIWAYLTTKWLRYAVNPVDREGKNQAHAKTSVFWKIVQEAYEYDIPAVIQKNPVRCNIEKLGKQIRGCIVSFLAGVGIDKKDYFGLIATYREFLDDITAQYFLTSEFEEKFSVRQVQQLPAF